MSGRPFFMSCEGPGHNEPAVRESAQGQVTHALTTAASGISAQMSGMICFMMMPDPVQRTINK